MVEWGFMGNGGKMGCTTNDVGNVIIFEKMFVFFEMF